jgi:hypothetical protein
MMLRVFSATFFFIYDAAEFCTVADIFLNIIALVNLHYFWAQLLSLSFFMMLLVIPAAFFVTNIAAQCKLHYNMA